MSEANDVIVLDDSDIYDNPLPPATVKVKVGGKTMQVQGGTQ